MTHPFLYRVGNRQKLDHHLVLFFINASLVIFSYLSTSYGLFGPVKALRLVLITLSIISLLFENRKVFSLERAKRWVLVFFILLLYYLLPFSASVDVSVFRLLVFTPFLIYLNLFVQYLYKNYDKEDILVKALKVFGLVYTIPIVNFYLMGNPLVNLNIYGDNSTGLESNNYGWSCTFVIAMAIDMKLNKIRPLKNNFFFLILILPAFFLLLISGSRSSYFCVIITFAVFILVNRKIHVLGKLLITMFLIYGTYTVLNIEGSAIETRIRKTQYQWESGGDVRQKLIHLSNETMLNNPQLIIHGVGFDNFKEGVSHFSNRDVRLPVHNSYYQVLIENGLILAIFFYVYFPLNTIRFYFKVHAGRFLFLPTLMIIPFFESDFGGGQFLFYPWFFFMTYYIYYPCNQIKMAQKIIN